MRKNTEELLKSAGFIPEPGNEIYRWFDEGMRVCASWVKKFPEIVEICILENEGGNIINASSIEYCSISYFFNKYIF